MEAQERRALILERLCRLRQDKTESLAGAFHVSERTIRNDLLILSCAYPIETVRGRNGGVRVAEGFYLHRRKLTSKQTELLRRLSLSLSGEDRSEMRKILAQFAPCGERPL